MGHQSVVIGTTLLFFILQVYWSSAIPLSQQPNAENYNEELLKQLKTLDYQPGTTVHVLQSGEIVDDEFWEKKFGGEFKDAIHLQVHTNFSHNPHLNTSNVYDFKDTNANHLMSNSHMQNIQPIIERSEPQTKYADHNVFIQNIQPIIEKSETPRKYADQNVFMQNIPPIIEKSEPQTKYADQNVFMQNIQPIIEKSKPQPKYADQNVFMQNIQPIIENSQPQTKYADQNVFMPNIQPIIEKSEPQPKSADQNVDNETLFKHMTTILKHKEKNNARTISLPDEPPPVYIRLPDNKQPIIVNETNSYSPIVINKQANFQYETKTSQK